MYSDVDMKMNVPALISRPAAIKELKGYIEKAIEKIGTIKDKYINIPDINWKICFLFLYSLEGILFID